MKLTQVIQSHGIPVKTYAGGVAHYQMDQPMDEKVAELVERLRNRPNDAPLPTEYMLDEAADLLQSQANRIAELEARILK